MLVMLRNYYKFKYILTFQRSYAIKTCVKRHSVEHNLNIFSDWICLNLVFGKIDIFPGMFAISSILICE